MLTIDNCTDCTELFRCGHHQLIQLSPSHECDLLSVELFLTASPWDRRLPGAYSLAHKWYMICYDLCNRNVIQLHVSPVLQDQPPLRLTLLDCGSQLPVVTLSRSLHPADYSTIPPKAVNRLLDRKLLRVLQTEDERDRWLDTLKLDHFQTQTPLLSIVADLAKALNLLLVNGSQSWLNRCLGRLDEHLKRTDYQFMDGNQLGYVDCALAPKLQHLRVAGNFYRSYSIPSGFQHIWTYIMTMYSIPAFRLTCPTDKDILLHHLEKAVGRDVHQLSKYKVQLVKLPSGFRLFTCPDHAIPRPSHSDSPNTCVPLGQGKTIVVQKENHLNSSHTNNLSGNTTILANKPLMSSNGACEINRKLSSRTKPDKFSSRTEPYTFYRQISPARFFSQTLRPSKKWLSLIEIQDS